jgi:hypothetical protein
MKFSAARSELDSMTVEIELTLVSIIQGVALFFLIDNARVVLTTHDVAFWLYIPAGLLVIFVFWSRSILHTLTVVRWPLEFGHNFLYLTCALFEALLFTKLSEPRAWFTLGAIYSAVGWSLFLYDFRLIRARESDSAGEASNRLYSKVRADQRLNVTLLLPAVFFVNLVCAFCTQAWPNFFLARNGHVWLIALQLLGFASYLFYSVRFYVDLAPFIAQARHEWRGTIGDREPS